MRPLPTPSCQGLHSSLSAMWDIVISWLEYSLLEMRFSYSLTRVIISWLIVSIWKPIVHPSFPLSISLMSFLLVGCSLPFSISLAPSFHLQHHCCCLCITFSQFPNTLCIPLILLVISFSISLSCLLFLSQLSHSLSPPSFSPLCLRDSHIRNERN